MKFIKQSLEEQATEYLRKKIISGELGPGEKIVESTLAKELNLSRSTVRMALNTLVHEGLITSKPYVGWEVFSLTEHDLWELYNLRLALEGQAAAMAAEKANPEDKLKLQEIYKEFCITCEKSPNDIHAVSQIDLKLHQYIIEISKNERLNIMYQNIVNQIYSYINITHEDYDLSKSGISHKAMIDAICNGDSELASKEAKDNMTPLTQLCAVLQKRSKKATTYTK